MNTMMNAGASLVPSLNPENILTVASGELDPERAYTELRLPSGQVIRLATELLTSSAEFGSQQQDSLVPDPGTVTIPLLAEKLEVSTRTVQTGKVRLHKTVQEYEEALSEPLAVQTFQVERVALNQIVDGVPEVRQEGDTTIYSVVEEQLILTKQIILKEEVRVTRQDSKRIDTQVVTLRRENLSIERTST